MKRFLPLLAVLMAGCLTVRAFNPFYTEEKRIPLPELLGEWYLIDTRNPATEATRISTWVFHGDPQSLHLRRYEHDRPYDFTVIPFRIAGSTYCDFSDPTDRLHYLYRLNFEGRSLALESLDGDWLTNSIATGTVKLPPPEHDGPSNLIFRANSQQWVEFLTGPGTNAPFSTVHGLTKAAHANFVPSRRRE